MSQPQRPIGKDIRAWLVENNPEALSPMPLSDIVRVACEDAPYNNRKGTWPTILTTWLPYFLDNEQYKQSYALIEAAFRYTNATEDQKNWASTLLNLPSSIRRTIFKQSQSLLLEAMHTTIRSKSLLQANMKGMFEDPSWFEPQWFNKWSSSKTFEILCHSGQMSQVSACLLHQWLIPKSTREERFKKWINAIEEVRQDTHSYAKLKMQLFHSWDVLLYNTTIGSTYLKHLNDQDLLSVSNQTNTTFFRKAKYNSNDDERLRDLIHAWLQRPMTTVDWTKTWFVDNSLTPVGIKVQNYLENWTLCVKERHWEQQERKLLLLNALSVEEKLPVLIETHTLQREGLSPYLRDLISSLGLKNNASLSGLHSQSPAVEEIQEIKNLVY